MKSLIPCLWFDDQAEQAAKFYAGIFEGSKIGKVTRYSSDAPGGKKKGDVLTVEIKLRGQPYLLLNGGPIFHFTEAVSFIVNCKDQAEIDRFWSKLSKGGEPGVCGWLKDRFGLSWQVVPEELPKLMHGKNGGQVMAALMKMKKLNLATLRRASQGK